MSLQSLGLERGMLRTCQDTAHCRAMLFWLHCKSLHSLRFKLLQQQSLQLLQSEIESTAAWEDASTSVWSGREAPVRPSLFCRRCIYIYINTRYKHIPSRKNSSGDIAYYISADQTLPRNLRCNIWSGTFHEFLEPPGSRLRLAETQ